MWAGYSFLLLWIMPALIWLEIHLDFTGREYHVIYEGVLDFIYEQAHGPMVWISCIFAVIIALGTFSYMGVERSCYFFHSLPIKRKGLFTTGFLSGISLMFVPNLVVWGLSNIICLSNNYNCIRALLTWLFLTTVEELFFYSLAVLCMIIFGNNIFASVIYWIIMAFSEGIVWILNGIFNNLYFGVSGLLLTFEYDPLAIVSPIRFFYYLNVRRDESLSADISRQFYFSNMKLVVVTALVVTVLMIAAAVLLYRIRRSENAGDFVAIGFLKPVFRWVFGISFGLLFTYFFIESLFSSLEYHTSLLFIAFVLIFIFGVIAYFAAEMILKKSFRIFKTLGKQFAIYVAALVIIPVLILVIGYKSTMRIPDTDKTESVYLGFGKYAYAFTDQETKDRIAEVHGKILENYDELTGQKYESFFGYVNYYGMVQIVYKLDNGKYVSRYYNLPDTSDTLADILKICNDNAEKMVLGDHEWTEFSGGEINLRNKDYEFDTLNLTQTQVKGLIEAIRSDIRSGNIGFEELSSQSFSGMYETALLYSVNLEYKLPVYEQEFNHGLGNLYKKYQQLYFTDKCYNTIKYLEENVGIPEGYEFF